MNAVSHLRWLVADLAPGILFWRDQVGLPQVVDVPGVYAEFASHGARIALYRADLMAAVVGGPPAAGAGGDAVICLRVDDVDRAAARLAAAGVIWVTPPHDEPVWRQRVAHVRDPAGHLVELWTPLPAAAAA
jgi:lactoylglutathione lyase